MKACPAMTICAVWSVRSPRIGRSRCLSWLWSASIGLCTYCSTWCHADGISSSSTAWVDRGRVGDHLAGRDLERGDGPLEESPGRGGISASRHEHVDDLSVLVDGPVDIAPDAVDLDVRLVDVPPVARGVAGEPGRVGQQRREALHHRNTVTWSTSAPRSTSSSSISRKERLNRRYQRTATTITSDGNRNPANADFGGSPGRGRFDDFTAQACLDLANAQRNGPFRMRSIERDAFTPATGYPDGIDIDGIPLRDRGWLDHDLR
jgi:hypothetical protein